MDEFAFIEYLKKKIPAGRRVCVGVGDDAAVLEVAKDKQLSPISKKRVLI
jgi:thiamine monophosphate kinase